jgi:hypothetical protein
VSGTGDAEQLDLDPGENMLSPIVNTGLETVILTQNDYGTGDTATMEYRTGVDEASCGSASWNNYTAPFASSGYAQIRLSNV